MKKSILALVVMALVAIAVLALTRPGVRWSTSGRQKNTEPNVRASGNEVSTAPDQVKAFTSGGQAGTKERAVPLTEWPPAQAAKTQSGSTSQSRGFDETFRNFEGQLTRYKVQLAEKELHTAAPANELDSAIKNLVRAGFEELRNFELVRKRLSQYIDFRALPGTPHASGGNWSDTPPELNSKALSDSELGRLPVTYYLHYLGTDRTAVTVMINALAGCDVPNVIPIQMAPFAVVESAGSIVFTPDITGHYSDPGAWVGFGSNMQILGALNIPQPVPACVFAENPLNPAGRLYVFVCAFNSKMQRWESRYTDEIAGIDDWSYDGTAQELTLHETGSDGSKNEYKFSVLEYARAWGPWTNWK